MPSVAVRSGFTVDRYEDDAVGVMTANERRKFYVSRVTLRPQVTFSGPRQPTADELNQMHHEAHEECFIANSVKTEVVVEVR